MTKQYRLLGLFLKLLKNAGFDEVVSLRLGAQIYRLKYLLLKMEPCGVEDMRQLCPMDELEELHSLLTDSANIHKARLVQQKVEDGLQRIIARLEATEHCNAVGTTAHNSFVESI